MEAASGPHAQTASELKAQIEAEREGAPFTVHRDAGGAQRILRLEGRELWIGRDDSAGLRLDADPEVSAVHAQLARAGEEWTLIDDGLSRNGSFVNGERVQGRRRLRDGDVLRFGQTVVLFRAPGRPGPQTTLRSGEALTAASLSDTQRRIVIALCRPFKEPSPFAAPPTNKDIAAELFLSVDAVKTHLRTLYEKFEVEELPQNRKRLALIERALQSGLIGLRDL